MPKNDAHLNEDKSIETEEVKVIGKSSKSFLFHERIKVLSSHRRPLKDRMRGQIVSYVGLIQPGSPPSRRNDEIKFESSKRFAKHKINKFDRYRSTSKLNMQYSTGRETHGTIEY